MTNKRKINKKRVIIAIIVYIVLISVISLLSPKLCSLIILFGMAILAIYGVAWILKEIKTVILIIGMIVAFTFLKTDAIDSVFLGFFFNTVYINLFFIPEWNRKKFDIKKEIDKEKYENNFILDDFLFDQVKERAKTIMTMLFYSISVLPAVTIEILDKNKVLLISIFPLLKKVYSFLVAPFSFPKIPIEISQRLSFSVFLVLFFMIANLLIIIISKQSRLTYKDINNKYDRPNNYWSPKLKPALAENELIYVNVKRTAISQVSKNIDNDDLISTNAPNT